MATNLNTPPIADGPLTADELSAYIRARNAALLCTGRCNQGRACDCSDTGATDTTQRFPRTARRPEPNAAGIAGPVVTPCSWAGRMVLALRRWLD